MKERCPKCGGRVIKLYVWKQVMSGVPRAKFARVCEVCSRCLFLVSGDVRIRRSERYERRCPECGVLGMKRVYWIPPKPRRREFGTSHVVVGMYCDICKIVYIVETPWKRLEEFS